MRVAGHMRNLSSLSSCAVCKYFKRTHFNYNIIYRFRPDWTLRLFLRRQTILLVVYLHRDNNVISQLFRFAPYEISIDNTVCVMGTYILA